MGCEEVEREVFEKGRRGSGEGVDEQGEHRGESGVEPSSQNSSDDDDDDSGGGVRLSGDTETKDATTTTTEPKQGERKPLTPQAYGLRRAREREQVRQAARRGVAFGFRLESGGDDGGGEERRRVEAVQNGRVVEASFAKGEWGVRWKQ